VRTPPRFRGIGSIPQPAHAFISASSASFPLDRGRRRYRYAPVLPDIAGFDLPAEDVAHHLHTVADAEDGYAGVQDLGVAHRRVGQVDAVWAAGQHYADGVQLPDGVGGGQTQSLILGPVSRGDGRNL